MSNKKPSKVDINKSDKPDKRLTAVFYDSEGKKLKTVHFGSGKPTGKGAFPDHKDPEIKKNWIARHSKVKGIDWTNPMEASTLSRYILWGEPTLSASIVSFKKRFNLK